MKSERGKWVERERTKGWKEKEQRVERRGAKRYCEYKVSNGNIKDIEFKQLF